ncbi:hypothetical protein HZ326_13459 [Fusarium oxysporum f. sp. albedinis]|nr:hypothetical protein HZ326_13459 [Fusarium oxysporum f. sp. albedinis]
MLAQAWLWKERNEKTKIRIHYHTWQNLLTSLGVSISLCDPTSVHESRSVSWFGPCPRNQHAVTEDVLGSNLNDFKITAKAKAVHTQQPKVANMFDEFSNAIEAMAEGLDNNSPDEGTAFVDAPPQEAIDIEEVPNGVPRKMEAGDLRTLTKAIMVASKCTLESNTIPNDLPDHIVQSIKRHDSWYMAIVDQVFDTVLKYTTRPKEQSPFSPEIRKVSPVPGRHRPGTSVTETGDIRPWTQSMLGKQLP